MARYSLARIWCRLDPTLVQSCQTRWRQLDPSYIGTLTLEKSPKKLTPCRLAPLAAGGASPLRRGYFWRMCGPCTRIQSVCHCSTSVMRRFRAAAPRPLATGPDARAPACNQVNASGVRWVNDPTRPKYQSGERIRLLVVRAGSTENAPALRSPALAPIFSPFRVFALGPDVNPVRRARAMRPHISFAHLASCKVRNEAKRLETWRIRT